MASVIREEDIYTVARLLERGGVDGLGYLTSARTANVFLNDGHLRLSALVCGAGFPQGVAVRITVTDTALAWKWLMENRWSDVVRDTMLRMGARNWCGAAPGEASIKAQSWWSECVNDAEFRSSGIWVVNGAAEKVGSTVGWLAHVASLPPPVRDIPRPAHAHRARISDTLRPGRISVPRVLRDGQKQVLRLIPFLLGESFDETIFTVQRGWAYHDAGIDHVAARRLEGRPDRPSDSALATLAALKS